MKLITFCKVSLTAATGISSISTMISSGVISARQLKTDRDST